MSTKSNILIEQGTTVHFEVQLYDKNGQPLEDTTGYTAASQIRPNFEANTHYDFVTSFTGGVLNLDMTANNAALIPPGEYSYDVELYVSGLTVRLLEGMCTVTSEITR